MSIKTGDRLKDLRKKHNFTQRDISNFLNISQSLIAKIESNERNLKIDSVKKLSN